MGEDRDQSTKPAFFQFPKWTNRLREIAALAAVAGGAYLALLVYWVIAPATTAVGYAPEQPVPYSHRVHVGELGLDCRYCHSTVEDAAHAAVPPATTCMNCHASIKSDAPSLEPIRNAVDKGEPLAWMRVHDLPDFVYFDHSAHVNSGVGCVSCHGRVDRMDVVRQEEALSMGWCLDCHRNPEAHLRPTERITDLAWHATPAEAAMLGEELARIHAITPSTDCSTCHR